MTNKRTPTSMASHPSRNWRLPRKRGLHILVTVLGTARLLCAETHAQYTGSFGINYNNPIAASVSSSAWSNWIVYQTQVPQQKGQAPATGSRSLTPTATSALAPAPGALSFRPSGTHFTTNKLAEMTGHRPQEKTQVATLLT